MNENQLKAKHSTTKQVAGLILSILVCFAVAGIGSAVTTPGLAQWYSTLNKPTWNPPNWIFAPVWTTLFLMMAVSAWLVWRKSGLNACKPAMSAFAIQLALNVGWSYVFFSMRRPDLALFKIILLWLAISVTIVLFLKHSKLAAGLLVPYLCWVSFAAFLNFTIWSLNG